jgi:hypothetical protein
MYQPPTKTRPSGSKTAEEWYSLGFGEADMTEKRWSEAAEGQ